GSGLAQSTHMPSATVKETTNCTLHEIQGLAPTQWSNPNTEESMTSPPAPGPRVGERSPRASTNDAHPSQPKTTAAAMPRITVAAAVLPRARQLREAKSATGNKSPKCGL